MELLKVRTLLLESLQQANTCKRLSFTGMELYRIPAIAAISALIGCLPFGRIKAKLRVLGSAQATPSLHQGLLPQLTSQYT